MACGVQSVGMQKRVARAARQLDEPVSFVRLEPFDDRVDRRGARIDWSSPSPHGRAAEPPPVRTPPEASTRTRPRPLRHLPILLKTTPAPRPKVLTLAHFNPKA